jgi:hypothetical protein
VDLEGLADQIVDEVDLGAGEVFERDRIDQHARTVALDDEIVGLAAAPGSPATICAIRLAARSETVTGWLMLAMAICPRGPGLR